MRTLLSHSALVAIAAVCHEANRAYCVSIGDDSQPAWKDAPAWQAESAFKGVEAIAEGNITEPRGSHASWSREKLDNGWKWGAVKDPEKKEHPCLVDFEQLPHEQQTKDHLFFAIASTLLARVPVAEPVTA